MIFWYLDGKPLKNIDINKVIKGKKVILFGADERRNKQLFGEVDQTNILHIFDNDETKWSKDFAGIPIVKPSDGSGDEMILSGIHDWKSITKQVHELGYSKVYFFLTEDVEERMGKYVAEFSPEIYDNSICENSDYKYIHVIPDEKFFLPVTEYIEYGFHMKEHFFVVYMSPGNHKDKYGVWKIYKKLSKEFHNIYLLHEECFHLNLYDWDENRGKLDKLLENADKILFHGEWFVPMIYEYFRKKTNLIKQKGIFFPWSGCVGKESATNNFIEGVLQFARMITYTFPIERNTLIKNFPLVQNAIWMKNGISYARLTEYIPRKRRQTKNVLIAHASHNYTKALETLRYLSGFKEKFHVFCVISYGPENIGREIKSYGKENFGELFTAVKSFMKYKEYVQFLSEMDVAIFGMDILSGRDTLELLFWLGAKVYLKPDSEASKCMKYIGYKVNDYYLAKDETIEELLNNPDEQKNHLIARNQFDPGEKMKQWKEIYEYNWG